MPILTIIYREKNFVVRTNACIEGLGELLMQ